MNATKTIPAEFGFNKKNLVTVTKFKIFPSFYLLINLIINPNKKLRRMAEFCLYYFTC